MPLAYVITGLLALLLVFGGVLALLEDTTGTPRTGPQSSRLVGQTLRSFSMERVGGRGRVLTPWAHHHPTVLVFFAKWCTVCATEVPRLAHDLGDGDVGAVRVLGVDADSGLSTAQGFVSSNHVRFPVGLDTADGIAYGLGFSGLPDTVFVAASGKVAAVYSGSLTNGELAQGLAILRRA
ncbi:MAG TPA: TlpA disulfide reductase family protein [Acidimicrobiales bacterium]|nr:TlpA disulfide reductase family protein [Acidimicrobiales bacterium]